MQKAVMNLKKSEEGRIGGFKGGKGKMLELNYSLKNKKKNQRKKWTGLKKSLQMKEIVNYLH